MVSKLLIVGAGGFGRVTLEHASRQFDCAFVDDGLAAGAVVIICSSAYISPHAQIGCGCVLLNNVVVQNGGRVGDGVLLNPGVEVHNDAFVDDYALIYTNSVVRALAHVGKRVRIGSNVSISNNVNVADDSDIPNGTTL